MLWEESFETLPHEYMRKLQLERLRTTVRHAYENVSHYSKSFDSYNL